MPMRIVYASLPNDDEIIYEDTLFKMESDAEKNGWQFFWSDDKTMVRVIWNNEPRYFVAVTYVRKEVETRH